MSTSPKYHLVCRDCERELLVETAGMVQKRAADHEALTGHRLDFKQVV